MYMAKRFSPSIVGSGIIFAGLLLGSGAVYGIQPAIPKIEHSVGWQLSQGCQVYKFGILTDPDCDILTGDGIAVQITRIRLLSLQPGQDSRSGIGIEFHPSHGSWSFSSPYVSLLIAERSYTPLEVDEAIVFAKGDRPSLERLQPRQQQYQLPPGEKRFFRLRFAVPQNELRNGFTLRIMGLQREGEVVLVPALNFEFK